MRALPTLCAAAFAGAAALLAAKPSAAGGEKSVGAMFVARCATCHTVPDPAIRTDLAWLDQVNRTS